MINKNTYLGYHRVVWIFKSMFFKYNMPDELK